MLSYSTDSCERVACTGIVLGGIVHFADTTEGKCHAELGGISPRGVE